MKPVAKMPMTMANCCSAPIRPRIWAGAISAMYIGAMTLATPMPAPPMKRQIMRSTMPKGKA